MKKLSQKQRILKKLQETDGWYPTYKFPQPPRPITRYNARISELRKNWHRIENKIVRKKAKDWHKYKIWYVRLLDDKQ